MAGKRTVHVRNGLGRKKEEARVDAIMSNIANAALQNLHELERLDKYQAARRRLEAWRLLEREAKARKRRIALRREQRAKAEAAARRMRRMRRFKLSGARAAAIAGVFERFYRVAR